MKAVVTVVILSLALVQADLAGECDMVAFYQELGCTPDRTNDSSICPDTFNCRNLRQDTNACYYKGVRYADGTPIPQSVIDHPCSMGCMCQVGYYGPEIQCAAVDCIESFRWRNTEGCVYTHRLNSCCSAGFVCDKDEIAKLKTCDYDGKIYKEGESFYPKNTHKKCICTDKWDGSIDNPSYCADIRCGIEIHSQSGIKGNCAPLFYENSRSCPITFICPTSNSEVRASSNAVEHTKGHCLFGNLVLHVGDEVSVERRCTRCRCDVPPFVTCTFTSYC